MLLSPRATRRTLATLALLLVAPASVFMAALFVRNVTPQPNEPAHTAQLIVMGYAAKPLMFRVLLMALPFAAWLVGCAALSQAWLADADLRQATRQAFAGARAHMATLLLAAATLAATGILAVVAVHVLTD